MTTSKTLDEMTKAELLAEATRVGADVAARWPRDRLLAAVEAAGQPRPDAAVDGPPAPGPVPDPSVRDDGADGPDVEPTGRRVRPGVRRSARLPGVVRLPHRGEVRLA